MLVQQKIQVQKSYDISTDDIIEYIKKNGYESTHHSAEEFLKKVIHEMIEELPTIDDDIIENPIDEMYITFDSTILTDECQLDEDDFISFEKSELINKYNNLIRTNKIKKIEE